MRAIIYKLCVQAGKWTAWACESDDRACKAESSWEMNVDAREVNSVCVTGEKRWRMEKRKWESCSSSCCGNKFTMLQMFGCIQNPFKYFICDNKKGDKKICSVFIISETWTVWLTVTCGCAAALVDFHPGIVYAAWEAGFKPWLMAFVSPVLSKQWQLKMSAVKYVYFNCLDILIEEACTCVQFPVYVGPNPSHDVQETLRHLKR